MTLRPGSQLPVGTLTTNDTIIVIKDGVTSQISITDFANSLKALKGSSALAHLMSQYGIQGARAYHLLNQVIYGSAIQMAGSRNLNQHIVTGPNIGTLIDMNVSDTYVPSTDLAIQWHQNSNAQVKDADHTYIVEFILKAGTYSIARNKFYNTTTSTNRYIAKRWYTNGSEAATAQLSSMGAQVLDATTSSVLANLAEVLDPSPMSYGVNNSTYIEANAGATASFTLATNKRIQIKALNLFYNPAVIDCRNQVSQISDMASIYVTMLNTVTGSPPGGCSVGSSIYESAIKFANQFTITRTA